VRRTDDLHAFALQQQAQPRDMEVLGHGKRRTEAPLPHRHRGVPRRRGSVEALRVLDDVLRGHAARDQVAPHGARFLHPFGADRAAHQHGLAVAGPVDLDGRIEPAFQPIREGAIGVHGVGGNDRHVRLHHAVGEPEGGDRQCGREEGGSRQRKETLERAGDPGQRDHAYRKLADICFHPASGHLWNASSAAASAACRCVTSESSPTTS
jgi:hypothetical protein